MSGYVYLKDRVSDLLSEYVTFCLGFDISGDEMESACIQNLRNVLLPSLCKLQEDHNDSVLSIAVLALTKSGKSTFINALIGEECMPSHMLPETARVCRVVCDMSITEPEMELNNCKIRGSSEILAELKTFNFKAREESCEENREPIEIRAPLFAFRNSNGQNTSKLHVLDTPGTNEAFMLGFQHDVNKVVERAGVVLYILDCTKIDTQDEESNFRRIVESNPSLMNRISDRLFFIANKADCHRGDISQVKSYIKNSLVRLWPNSDGEDTSHKFERFHLLCAKRAFLIRSILSRKATRDVKLEFVKEAYGVIGWEQHQDDDLELLCPVAQSMLSATGIAEIESDIMNYLYSNSGRLQLESVIENLLDVHCTITNSLQFLRSSLLSSSDELHKLESKLRERKLSIEETKMGLVGIGTTFEKDLNSEICKLCDDFEDKLVSQLRKNIVFEGDTVNLKTKDGLYRKWGKLSQLLFGTYSSEFVKDLTKLHESFLDILKVEVELFWNQLEVFLDREQGNYYETINTTLNDLSKELEDILLCEANVSLSPKHLKFKKPKVYELHDTLDKLLTSTISVEHRSGICWYYREFKKVESVNLLNRNITAQVKSADILRYYEDFVKGIIKKTKIAIPTVLHEALEHILFEAQPIIIDYYDVYLQTIKIAREYAQENADSRRTSLDKCEKYLIDLERLKLTCENVQACVTDLGASI